MTRARVRAGLLSALLLAGCAGAPPPAVPGPVSDQRLDQTRHAAALAFSRRDYEQAVRLYGQALELAQSRDDGEAMGDLGYDLALAHLRRGDVQASLAASAAARAELRRHARPVFPELALVEAVAWQRAGRSDAAEAAASGLAGPGIAGDPVARRARFLLGLIAAERGDVAGLAAHRAALPDTVQSEWRADIAELEARSAALAMAYQAARDRFLAAADLRRDTLDYPGLARALAGGAASALAGGDRRAAADLYLRAGRSLLLAGGGTAQAEDWLAAAERLAREAGDDGLRAEAAGLRGRVR